MEQLGQEDQAPTPPGRHFGAVVRGARTAQGVTLAELGRRIGYSPAQVSRYERGLAPLTDIAVTGGKGVDVVLDCTSGAGTAPVLLGIDALKRREGTLLIQG